MASKATRAQMADELLRDRGLEPLDTYVDAKMMRDAKCMTCGTLRRVRTSNLRQPGSVACRWCHGWAQWAQWGEDGRERASGWKAIAGPEEVRERLRWEQLAPLTPVGDEYTPVGFLCLRCGETGVTMPERIRREQPGWFGCSPCNENRKAKVRHDAPGLFNANGLSLDGPCRGEYVPQPCTCIECGSTRHVSYADLVKGTAPLCWTCTYGIRPDEPHRVYLVRFGSLGLLKVGITHDRHDRRLGQHESAGGEVLETVLLSDRAGARLVERWVIARYSPWARTGTATPELFPQGGWTETWAEEDAPPLSLVDAAEAVGAAMTA